MNDKLERNLKHYHEQFTRDYRVPRRRLLDDVADAKAAPAESVPPERRFDKRKWLLPTTLGAAATILIGLTIGSILFGSPRSLYAKAVKAIAKARSVHAVGKTMRDGQWQTTFEVWYDRERGVAEWSSYFDDQVLRIDDGTHQWLYRSQTGKALRTKSKDAMGPVAELLDFDKLFEHREQWEREPAEDKNINGIACRVYVAIIDTPNPNSEKIRSRLWFDDRERLHRAEEHWFRDGRWHDDEQVTISYDLVIDSGRFEPSFDENVVVVDTSQVLEDRFNLEDAIFTTERMGLVFAMHELKRVEGGDMYLVHTTRPAQATIDRFGRILSHRDGTKVYGTFVLEAPYELIDGQRCYYQPMSLATQFLDGMRVEWLVLLQKAGRPLGTETCKFIASVYTREKLQKRYKDAGEPWYINGEHLGELRLPTESVSMDDVVRAVYDEASLLNGVGGRFTEVALILKPGPLSERQQQEEIERGTDREKVKQMMRGRRTAPDKIQFDAYRREIDSYIQYLRHFGEQ